MVHGNRVISLLPVIAMAGLSVLFSGCEDHLPPRECTVTNSTWTFPAQTQLPDASRMFYSINASGRWIVDEYGVGPAVLSKLPGEVGVNARQRFDLEEERKKGSISEHFAIIEKRRIDPSPVWKRDIYRRSWFTREVGLVVLHNACEKEVFRVRVGEETLPEIPPGRRAFLLLDEGDWKLEATSDKNGKVFDETVCMAKTPQLNLLNLGNCGELSVDSAAYGSRSP